MNIMKPENNITNIINAISIPERICKGRERQIITMACYDKPMCFILHEGLIAVYRGRDQLLMTHTNAPMLFGLNDLYDICADLVIQARGEISYEITPQDVVFETIKTNSLWQDVAYLNMFNIARFLELHSISVGLSTYELIRLNLCCLMEEKKEVRLGVNACEYIQEKTHLSRSRIMKILSDLKAGNYIDIRRGVLNEIKHIPEKY